MAKKNNINKNLALISIVIILTIIIAATYPTQKSVLGGCTGTEQLTTDKTCSTNDDCKQYLLSQGAPEDQIVGRYNCDKVCIVEVTKCLSQ